MSVEETEDVSVGESVESEVSTHEHSEGASSVKEDVGLEVESKAPITEEVDTSETDDQDYESYKFRDHLKEEYKEHPALKGYNNLNDMAKSLIHAQSLVGKKMGIPAQDAPDSEWEEFRSRTRPESVDKYEFGIDASKLPEHQQWFLSEVKNMFFEEGIDARTAKRLQQKYDGLVAQMGEKYLDVHAQQDQNFEDLVVDVFGPKAQKVIDSGRFLLDKFVPAKLKPHLEGLDNNSLALLAAVLDGVNTHYIKEDAMPQKHALRSSASQGDVRTQGRAMQQKAIQLRQEGKWAEAEKVEAEIKAFYTGNFS